MGEVKNKIMSLVKPSTTKKYSKTARLNNAYRGRKKPRKQAEDKRIKTIEDRIIRDIRKYFD